MIGNMERNGSTAMNIGFWGAVVTTLASFGFFLGSLYAMSFQVSTTVEYILKYGTSFIIPLGFIPMMTAVNHVLPEEKRIWGQLGMNFATVYATLVLIVYVTLLFVTAPHINAGKAETVASFGFGAGSFLQLLDGLGYALQCVALAFIAPAFGKHGRERAVRLFCIANAVAVVPVFLSYIYFNIALGIWWMITVPGACMALASYFKAGIRVSAGHGVKATFKQ